MTYNRSDRGLTRMAYSPIEVGQMLGVSARKVITLINRGEIRAFRIDGMTRIAHSEVEAYMARRMIADQPVSADA